MRKVLIPLALLGVLSAAPREALACAVCFGQSDSPMAVGVNMGIFLMLGVTGVVLGGFASFFIYLARRARIFSENTFGENTFGGNAETRVAQTEGLA